MQTLKRILNLSLIFILLFFALTPVALARPVNDFIGSSEDDGTFPYYGNNYEFGQKLNNELSSINRIEDQILPSLKAEEGRIPLWKGYGAGQYIFLTASGGGFSDLVRGNIEAILQSLYSGVGNFFFLGSKLITLLGILIIEFCFSEQSITTPLIEELPTLLQGFYAEGLSGSFLGFIFFIAVMLLGITAVFSFLRGRIVKAFTNIFVSALFVAFFLIYLSSASNIISPIIKTMNQITAITIQATENLNSGEFKNHQDSVYSLSDRIWNNLIGVTWATAQFGTADITSLKLTKDEVEKINSSTRIWKFGQKDDPKKGFHKSGGEYTGDYYMDRVFLGGCNELKASLLDTIGDNVGDRDGDALIPVLAVQPTVTTGLNHLTVGILSLIPSVIFLLLALSVGLPIIFAEIMLVVIFFLMPIILLLAASGETGRPIFIKFIKAFFQFLSTKIVLGFYLGFTLSLLTLFLSFFTDSGVSERFFNYNLGLILFINSAILGLAFWYRKKPMEMMLALLAFSFGGSTGALSNLSSKGEGSAVAKTMAGYVIGKTVNTNKSETPPLNNNSPREAPPTLAERDVQRNQEYINLWEQKMQDGDYKGAENIFRRETPNLKDKNGATIPTKIGQMENEKDRKEAWSMFTRNKGNPNFEDGNKQTAIFHTKTAWETAHIANNGADLNHKDKDGDTALHQAIKTNNIEKSQVLIDKGADVNIQDNENKTPLMRAIEKEDYSTAESLVNKGADINIKDNKGRTIKDYPCTVENTGKFHDVMRKAESRCQKCLHNPCICDQNSESNHSEQNQNNQKERPNSNNNQESENNQSKNNSEKPPF